MNTQTFTVTSENEWHLFIMNLLDSTGRSVASLLANWWEKGTIYTLDINIIDNDGDNPEIKVQFIQKFIEQIQEWREEGFTIIIKLRNYQDDKQYGEVAILLKERNYIDSFRFHVTKGTSDKYIQLSCS